MEGRDGAAPEGSASLDALATSEGSVGPPDAAVSEDASALDAEAGQEAAVGDAQPAEAGPRVLAFPGAEGFGAYSEGGRGGVVYTVRNLADSGEGSFRWAVERPGRRIVEFAVTGTIQLLSPIDLRDPYVTIDGATALRIDPAGITLRDHTLNIATHDVVVRYLKVRHGDYAVARSVLTAHLTRPRNSDDLDCINIDRSQNVLLDHISASWSADEIISVTNSHNVTIQWSILSEPLGGLRDGIYIHPYGDNHHYPANNSASTLTYHHNLFAHFRFRGPQFEPNDAAAWRSPDNPSFEAVNNVVYAYTDSGSRFRYGFELASDRNALARYFFHFVGNRYLDSTGNETELHAATDVGVEPNILAYFRDNIGPHRRSTDPQTALVFTSTGATGNIRSNAAALRQVSASPLFVSTVPVTVQSADAAMTAVLAGAGATLGTRDVIDARVVADARANRAARLVVTQEGLAGGWPSYHP